MDQTSHCRCSRNIFVVDPNFDVIPFKLDVQDTPLSHENFRVYNIGHVDVIVDLLSGACGNWVKLINRNTIQPGQTVIFDNAGKKYFDFGVRISNEADVRAIVYTTLANFDLPSMELREPTVYGREYNNLLRNTYSVGVRNFSYLSKKFGGLCEVFWPTNKLSVWQEMLLKLEPLLRDDVYQTIFHTVCKFSRDIQLKLNTFSRDFNKGLPIPELYMTITEDLLEFEKQIIPVEDDAKYLLLPLFSNFLLLKTIFLTLGKISYSDIGMSYEHLPSIKNLLEATKTSSTYIKDILKDRLKHAYNTAPVEDLYNSITNVRTYVAVHGVEYSILRDSIIQDPHTDNNVFYEEIVYSNFFGRQTPSLVRQATAKEMCPPLTPLYIGFFFSQLASIEVYLWVSKLSPELPKIGGIKLTFDNLTSFIMGSKTELIEQIDMMKAYISKLHVTGTGAVDSCTFHMSDGRVLFFGTKENDSEEVTFGMEGYRIVSMYLSSDDDCLGGQAANIAVSYQRNSVRK